jgi:hypothetical protein
LISLDRRIEAVPDYLPQRVRLKLQLGIAYFALSDVANAKASFIAMCELDPECSIDANKYPPKVIALFEEAKAEQDGNRCRILCDSVKSRLAAGEVTAIAEQLGPESCRCALDAVREFAERLFQAGIQAYLADDFAASVKNLSDALKLRPDHALTAEYLMMTQAKLRAAVEQRRGDWRKSFQAGSISSAFAMYNELVALNIDGVADTALEEMNTAYRKRVASSLEAWKGACKTRDAATMDRLRRQAELILPDPQIGQDLLDQMTGCPVTPCISMDVEAVLPRLRSSFEPEIPADLRRSLSNTSPYRVQVQARIEENGDVFVLAVNGQNAAVNNVVGTAVERWKFSPTITDNESRCVETVFPIVITPRGPN